MNPGQQETLPEPEDGGYENLATVQHKRRPGRQACSHIVLLGVIPCITLLVGIAGGYLAAYYLGHHGNCINMGKELQRCIVNANYYHAI